MKCLACGWNSPNVSEVSWCPNCGDDWNIVDVDGKSISTEIEACVTCDEEMLYWQIDNHSCPQEDLPVDNFFPKSKSLRP